MQRNARRGRDVQGVHAVGHRDADANVRRVERAGGQPRAFGADDERE